MKIYGDAPQIQFGISQIRQVSEIPELTIYNLDSKEGREQWKKDAPEKQGYVIEKADSGYQIAGDANGCMYALLDISDSLSAGKSIRTGTVNPAVLNRGIKMNIPLDARTPSYADDSESGWLTIPEVWEEEFWKETLDTLARNKYNLVSLWSLNPFPSMVRTPGFERVALEDVKRTPRMVERTSLLGFGGITKRLRENLVTVKKISVDEKIEFWKRVMQYGADRGIRFIIVTWNIFVYGTEGSGYGITDKADNPVTKEYFRRSVEALIKTYPLLAGIGVTAGERMSGFRDSSEDLHKDIRWIAETYGAGVKDAFPEGKDDFLFIHRQHLSDTREIIRTFSDLGVEFAMSFKHSKAHMYSSPDPAFGKEFYRTLPEGVKTFLTIRNDDMYMHRWGGIEFARQYIRHLPFDKMLGFMMGPDGFTLGYDNLQRSNRRRLSIQRREYAYAIWGRLAYQPDLPEDALLGCLKALLKADGETAQILLCAGNASGWIVPFMNMAHWHDYDFHNYTEGNCSLDWKDCIGFGGKRLMFHGIHDYVLTPAQPGSECLSVQEAAKLDRKNEPVPQGKITPVESARRIEEKCGETFALLEKLPELTGEALELADDFRGMALLGMFFAKELRCAMEVQRVLWEIPGADPVKAIHLSEEACGCWKTYADHISARYYPHHLARLEGRLFDCQAMCAEAEEDARTVRYIMERYMPG